MVADSIPRNWGQGMTTTKATEADREALRHEWETTGVTLAVLERRLGDYQGAMSRHAARHKWIRTPEADAAPRSPELPGFFAPATLAHVSTLGYTAVIESATNRRNAMTTQATTTQLIRALMASASVRVSDDAAQVAELAAAIAQMQINLEAAKMRLARSQASASDLQRMWASAED